MRQRGIPAILVDIIEQCGRVSYVPGGAEKVFLGKREADLLRHELRRMLQILDKAQGAALIVKDGCILTAYKRSDN
jgi:hypothetical protein